MRSLFVAPTLPSDAGNGLAMRIGVFLEALSQLGDVDLIVLPLFGAHASTNALCRRLDVDPIILQTEGRADTPFRLLSQIADPQLRLASFRQYGKPSLSAFVSVAVLDEIRQLTADRRYDLVHIARAYLLPVIDAWPKDRRPPATIDVDDDDVEALRSIAVLHRCADDVAMGDWLDVEAVAFERLLEQKLGETALAFVSTARDLETLRRRHSGSNLIVTENVVSLPAIAVRERSGSELLFVGGFGYFPNLDAAFWILGSIFPLLTASLPGGASLTIVGRNPPTTLRTRARSLGVNLLDNVDELAPFYARATIALVPMRAGGGSRIKLLEAAAHGVPIVATKTGAEGTHMRDGTDLWLADSAEAIVSAVIELLRSPAEAARRAANARAVVEEFHSRETSVATLSRQFARAAGARKEAG